MAYNPKSVETNIYERWERSGYFNPDKLPGKRRKTFSIAMPPPNVTGTLHAGHALHIALEDLMTRYHRMRGEAALWIPGTDHAGIATQIMVERMLAEQGISRHDVGRNAFLKHVWAWKERHGSRIVEQTKSMGASCDWSREHFTMDPNLTAAVHKAFIRLFDDGLIYRAERLINWCPNDRTALSDLEIDHEERAGSLWYINYRVQHAPHAITVATTRPETLLGDTAVAVNPKDERYKDLIGRTVTVPIVNRQVPVIADPRVEKDFGTGAVKVTPAHDFLDAELGKTHGLPSITVIGPDARMTRAAGRDFEGLPTYEARTLIVEALGRDGLLEKTEDYRSAVSVCGRCQTTIEPQISPQWFVRMQSLAKPALAAVRTGKIKILPERFKKQYFHWMENIQDWCISRQLWWGHRIPVWYCGGQDVKRMGFAGFIAPQVKTGKVTTWRLRDHGFQPGDVVTFIDSGKNKIIGQGTITSVERTTVGALPLADPTHHKGTWTRKKIIYRFGLHNPNRTITEATEAWIYRYRFEPRVKTPRCGETVASERRPVRCRVCGGRDFVQDDDVLDTWFSSALWTFSTLGWPKNQGGKVKKGDLRRFHPTSVMETAWDILTFWVSRMIMLSLYLTGEVPFKTVYLSGLILDKQGKKMSKSKGTGIDPLIMTEKYGTDALRLALVIGQTAGQDFRMFEEKIAGQRNFVNKLWNVSQYMLTASQTMKFVERPKAKTLADRWILSRLSAVTKEATAAIERYDFSAAGQLLENFAWHDFADWYLEIHKIEKNDQVLLSIFLRLLKLLHPFAPFITEALWQSWDSRRLLMIEPWPKAATRNPRAEKTFADFQRTVLQLRSVKLHADLSSGAVVGSGANQETLSLLTKLTGLVLGPLGPNSTTIRLGQTTISLPPAAAETFGAWRKQRGSELTAYIERLEQDLGNARLPEAIQAEKREKLATARLERSQL